MTRTISVTLIALLALGTSSYAQPATSDSAPTAEKTGKNLKPRELSTLIFDEAQSGFVDPESREPYTGPMIVTYPNGQLETDGWLVNGLEEGDFIEYYPDGSKSGVGAYRGGTEVGPWTYWWENGKIESEGEFKDGSMDGVWRDYQPSGKLANEGAYMNGLAQGKWKVTDDDTGEITEVYYEKGEEVAPPDAAAKTAEATPAASPDATPEAEATATPEPTPAP